MKIFFKRSAQKELLSLPKPIAKKIFQKITFLTKNPYVQGSQKLEEGKGYRIRMGDYRVVYTVDKKSKTVCIFKIGHRRESYR